MSLVLLALAAGETEAVEITEVPFQGRPHFQVRTERATWLYDRAGGGFSRLVDREGRDWIAFGAEPLSRFPDSAAAGYRGLPNLVFVGPDKGAGHPGFDRCTSETVGEDTGKEIVVYCDSGRFASAWWFLLREAFGYKDVKVYDGSAQDWAKDTSFPMEP